MRLLKSAKDIIDADKNSENVPMLENVEVVLVHCNLVNNSYHQASRVLFTFVPTKQYEESYAYCGRNTYHRQSMCYQTDLRFKIRVRQTFSNSIYLEFMAKKDNSGALLLSLLFGTR